MKKVTIFDNGGATFDRYTIILNNGEMFGSSDHPFAPNGFGNYAGNIAESYYRQTVGSGFISHLYHEDKKHYNKIIKQATKEQIAIAKNDPAWLGKEIKEIELPADVQKYIKQLQN